ncbi:S1 family peptidase [Streptomyces chumphonensis]|uniref:S1 family peptidase n=2 Tax=Streptomyces chumphonensis TaxID=1214925 RepID=A0A927EVY4_9ACTN|nr:S1 family peptidase [Streptomyces chumphonensis]
MTAPVTAQANGSGDAERYQPEMITALAASLDVTEADAVALLDDQAQQERTLDSLEAKGLDSEGAFFDERGDLVVNVADAAARDRVEKAGLDGRIAEHGDDVLRDVMSTLNEAATQRTPSGVTAFGVDLADDVVTIEVRDASAPATQAFLKKAEKFGDAVRTVETDERLEAQTTVYPGSEMNPNNNPNSWCSVGYGARDRSGNQYLVSAGHCISPDTGLYFDGGRFAVGDHTRYSLGTRSVDMGVARIDRGDSIATQVGTWGNGSNKAVRGSQRGSVGSTVCKSGATTGWTCGEIDSYNRTVTYVDRSGGPDTVVTGLASSSVCTEGGDSGGAYISGDQAQGMTSGGPLNQRCSGGVYASGSSYFQPLDDALSYYGLTLNTH